MVNLLDKVYKFTRMDILNCELSTYELIKKNCNLTSAMNEII